MGISSSSQKQNSTGATTSSYDYKTPPISPALQKLSESKFDVDPGLHAQYGRLRNELKSGFNNPLGANYSSEVRDAIIRSGNERLGQQEAEAYRGGESDVNRLNYARDSTVAGMQQPQLVQTSGTSTGSGTITQNPAWGPQALSAASSVAPLSM